MPNHYGAFLKDKQVWYCFPFIAREARLKARPYDRQYMRVSTVRITDSSESGVTTSCLRINVGRYWVRPGSVVAVLDPRPGLMGRCRSYVLRTRPLLYAVPLYPLGAGKRPRAQGEWERDGEGKSMSCQ